MWVLVQEPGPDLKVSSAQILQQSQNKWILAPGNTYKVGRVEADICCPQDGSVSKSHAQFVVTSGEDKERPEVMLEDIGSKFGTHLNAGILQESQRLAAGSGNNINRAMKKPQVLDDNDRIRFGVAYSIFRLKWVVLDVTSSMLRDRTERTNLSGWVSSIHPGADINPTMTETTSHLVMNNISLSIKVVNCLARGIPIVSPEYFRDLHTCIQTRQKLPREVDYLPPVSNNVTESQLKDPNISFQVNLDRSRLFVGKTIIFVDKKQFDQNSPCCELAGGKALLLTQPQVIDITHDHIVIQPSKSITTSDHWNLLSATMTSMSMIPCPVTDIYLAIVHCSISHFCNPLKKLKKEVLAPVSGSKINPTILAPETCSTLGTPSVSKSSKRQVSETLSNKSVSSGQVNSVPEETLEPYTGETQDPGRSFKRPRSSDDNEDHNEPPAKVLNVSKDPVDTGLRSTNNTPDMFTNHKQKSSTYEIEASVDLFSNEKENKDVNVDDDEDDDDEDDMFGFGSLKTKKKRTLSSPEKTQSNQKEKRLRQDDEDDIFGFDEIKKEPVESVNSGQSENCDPDPGATGKKKEEHTSIENKNGPPNESKIKVSLNSTTGFIGKLDIKTELTDETVASSANEDTSTSTVVSSLSTTIAKITLTSLVRPKSSRPQYVPHPEPDMLGKPVTNFKKFKRKQIDKSRTVITLVKYEASDMNQTGVSDWFKDNKDVKEKEDEQQQLTKQSEDFWDFETSQVDNLKRRKNPFARK